MHFRDDLFITGKDLTSRDLEIGVNADERKWVHWESDVIETLHEYDVAHSSLAEDVLVYSVYRAHADSGRVGQNAVRADAFI